jgi:5-methyltetrahydropteroyltriglutamate--homocysteine methyltransferase
VAGAPGPTVLHICFGYGHHVADKPSGYHFLPELESSSIDEISIEAAQPHLDLDVLEALPSKRIHLGVLDLRDASVETPEAIAARLRDALGHIDLNRLAVAPDCGLKYLGRDIAFAKIAAMVQGADLLRAELEGPAQPPARLSTIGDSVQNTL